MAHNSSHVRKLENSGECNLVVLFSENETKGQTARKMRQMPNHVTNAEERKAAASTN